MGVVQRAATHLVGALLLSACASARSRDYLDPMRVEDMASIERLSGLERADELRVRIQRDAAEAYTWGATSDLSTISSIHQLANVQMWAHAVDNIAFTYVKVGDALQDGGDPLGAIAAYESAIRQADGLVISAALAAEVRAKAMRGQEAVWRSRGEKRRAAAASLLASGQERWLDGDEAEEARRSYGRLLDDSREASGEIARRKNAAARAAIGQALDQSAKQIDQQLKNQGQTGSSAQMGQVYVQTAQALANVLSPNRTVQFTKGDFEALSGLFAKFPAMMNAMRRGGAEAFVSSPTGARQVAKLMGTLTDLRRGAPMEKVAVAKRDEPTPSRKPPAAAPPPPPPTPASPPPPPPPPSSVLVAPPSEPQEDPAVKALRDKVDATLTRAKNGELSRAELIIELRDIGASTELQLEAAQLSELVSFGALDISGFHKKLRAAFDAEGPKK